MYVISGIAFLSLFCFDQFTQKFVYCLIILNIIITKYSLYIGVDNVYTTSQMCKKKSHVIFLYPRWHPSSYPHQALVTSGSLECQTGADENLGVLAQAFSLAEHTTLPFASTVTECCWHEGILQACCSSAILQGHSCPLFCHCQYDSK